MAGNKGYSITFDGRAVGCADRLQHCDPRRRTLRSGKSRGAGHLVIAIDVAAMGHTEDYLASDGQLIDEIKTTTMAPGHDEIFYPGELEDRNEHNNLTVGGVILPNRTRTELEKLAPNSARSTPEHHQARVPRDRRRCAVRNRPLVDRRRCRPRNTPPVQQRYAQVGCYTAAGRNGRDEGVSVYRIADDCSGTCSRSSRPPRTPS